MRLSRPWLALVLALFCLPLFVGLGRADIEGDEAIYSFGVDRLLEIGDWLVPRSSPHEDAPFLEKPPLKFWIVALPMHAGLLPHDEFGMRFWDALFGGIGFAYVFAIGSLLAGPLCGVVAALLLFLHGPLLFEHGLRTNNMEAALFLSYCAGIYHFVRWARAETDASRSQHAAGVALAFVLGFMTKFVAVLFLPMVLGVSALLFSATRRRLFAEWRRWAAVIGLTALICAPWFVYAQWRFGSLFWETILQEHVYNRFTSFLDPAHVHPWHYYVSSMYDGFGGSGSAELAIAGLALLLLETVRRRWFEGFLVLCWLVLPIALMSAGTSKLYHYAYPFVPPVALAVGHLAALGFTLAPLVLNAALRWVDRALIAPRARLVAALERPAVRTTLQAVASLALAIGAVSLIYGPIRLEWGSTVLFRSSGVLRPAIVALVCGLLAGARRSTSLAVGAILVAGLLPIDAYRATLTRLTVEQHPMRTTTDCLQAVDRTLSGAAAPGLYVDLPQDVLTHGMNYYFRRVRPWTRAAAESPEALDAFLTDPSKGRPLLVYDATYQKFMRGPGDGARLRSESPPMVSFPNVVLLLPGPYASCAGVTGTRGLGRPRSSPNT